MRRHWRDDAGKADGPNSTCKVSVQFRPAYQVLCAVAAAGSGYLIRVKGSRLAQRRSGSRQGQGATAYPHQLVGLGAGLKDWRELCTNAQVAAMLTVITSRQVSGRKSCTAASVWQFASRAAISRRREERKHMSTSTVWAVLTIILITIDVYLIRTDIEKLRDEIREAGRSK